MRDSAGFAWETVRFAEVCEHSAFGPRFSGEMYAPDGNIATLRTTDIDPTSGITYSTMPRARLDISRLEQHLLQRNDLVMTRSGRVGTTAVFRGHAFPVLPGAFLIRFRLKTDIASPPFYDYFFKSPVGQSLVMSIASGSVQQNVNITNLHNLCVPLPPLPVQRQVVRIVGTLDDKIELNRRMNETLEAIFRPELLARLSLDASLVTALTARMEEAHACIQANAFLAAVILSGSVLEGLCLGYGSRSSERVNRAYAEHYKRHAPQFRAWKLREWIDVLGRLGDLSPNVEKFGHALRDFRNFVHPAEQLAQRFTPDQHTARIGFQVVVAAIEDLVRASDGRKAATR